MTLMQRLKARLIEIAVLVFGMIAAISALIDTGKAWHALTILTMTMGLDAVLERLRESQEGKATV